MPPKKEKKKKEPEPVEEEEPEHNDPLRPHGRKVTWTISIKSAKDVPSATEKANKKNDVASCVRFQWPGQDKPTQTNIAKDGDRTPVFDYETTFEVKNTEEYLTSLANAEPLVFTLCDGTKEKKPDPIGTVTIPWEQFLRGATELQPLPIPEVDSEDGEEAPDSNAVPDGTDGWYRVVLDTGLTHVTEQKPELQIHISLSEPLLTEEQVAGSNIITVSVDDVFNLPKKWLVDGDADVSKHIFRYVTNFTWPVHADKETPVICDQGTFALPPPPPSKEAGEGGDSDTEAKAGKGGNNADDEEDPSASEPEKQRVHFGQGHTFFLSPSAIAAMRAKFDEEQPIIAEFARKVKDEKLTDHNYERYHGQAELSLAPILSPGIDHITVRVPITHYIAPEPSQEETQESEPKKSPRDGKPGSSKGGKKKAGKHPELEAETGDDIEEHPYEAAQTYLVVTFRTQWGSITPRLPTPPPKTPIKPADLIPTRPPVPKYVPPTNATEEFRRQIVSIVHTLREEYETLFNNSTNDDQEDAESKRKKLVFELNENGMYYTFKEKLKLAVIKVARETVHANGDIGQAGSFHNELYVTLVRNMHAAINQFVHQHDLDSLESFNLTPELVPTEAHDESRVRLATEAEWNGDYERAADHLKQRIVNHKENPDMWFDYGAYCMRRQDIYKAEECFREGLALDPQSLPNLLAYGSLLLGREEYEHADVFIDEAAETYDTSLEALTLKGLSAELQEKKDEAKHAFKTAQQLIENPDVDLTNVLTESRHAFNPHVNEDTPYLQLVNFCVAVNLTTLAEALLEREVRVNGRSFRCHIYYAKLYLANGDLGQAQEHIDNAFGIDDKNSFVWGLQGHVHYASGDQGLAEEAYETCVAKADVEEMPDPSVYARLGAIYLAQQRWTDAKDVFYKACEAWPSSTTWKGVGEAYYRLNDTALAEDAFAEANVLDARNADVWGWLTLVCIRSERIPEADKCYASARQTGLDNARLLAEMGDAYFKRGRAVNAERAVRAALSLCPDDLPRAHIVLADILSQAGKEEEASQHYTQALNSAQVFEGDRNHAHRRLKVLQESMTESSLVGTR
eukprot:TRINITY_DN6963_c0_g1_i1.p1 TRINITY_DN6963_c0_g1~~TRINITY_DN6963_c0_g1_i1.p1  ORF type:complete len:1080 (+),score=323.74 TRINITY_DN6963_c0_g1_i1:257-3496(+)